MGWMNRMLALSAALLALVAWSGCGDADEAAVERGPEGSGGTGGEPDDGGTIQATIGSIDWTDCQASGYAFLCAEIDVPLNWDDAESQRISFFVRKLPTRAATHKGQLWLFVGGPGYGGSSILPIAPYFSSLGFDVYVPDYRGVGRSTPLACTGDSMSAACKLELWDRFGEGLRFFSTTDAATDIGRTIEATRELGEKVFVYGSSYGTFLGNRYLTLFPDQADGAILDGICPATGCNIHQDLNLNLVAKRVFDLCGQDAACSGKLGTDPWATLGDLQRRLASGHCPDFAGPYGAQALSLILSTTVDHRDGAAVALASAYRLDRCSPDDAVAVRKLLEEIAPRTFDPVANAPRSDFLYAQILLSEFWDEGLESEDLIDELANLYVAPGYGYTLASMRDEWLTPFYETPAELYRWADVSIPVLLINGTLDAQTPEWDLVGIQDAFSRYGQSYVEIPFGAHGGLWEGRAFNAMGTCGFKMVSEFLQSPYRKVDTSCLAGLEVLDLEGDRLPAVNLFGTTDLWENGIRASQAPDLKPIAPLERHLDRAKREADGLRRW